MTRSSDTKYALLGLLTQGCKTGYEMKQMIDRSLTHFWKQSYGQIYPHLKRLVDEGLVTMTTSSQDGKPDRKEYTITYEGLKALKEWVDAPISNLPAEKNEYLLKLFFSRHSDQRTTLNHLSAYEEQLRHQLSTYEAIEDSIQEYCPHDDDALYWLLTLDFGKRKSRAALDWCKGAREKLMQS